MPQDQEKQVPVQLAATTLAAETVRVAFRDKAFRSRTLVLANGRTLSVEKSTVTTSDQQQIAMLDGHPDFERVVDGA